AALWHAGVGPASPAVVPGGFAELGLVPGFAAVDAHLDSRDRRPARPGSAPEQAGARLGEAPPFREVRDARRDEQRARLDPRHGLARVVLGLLGAVLLGLLKALERLGDGREPIEPLDVGHALPARDDEAQREAVLRG